LNLLQNRAQSRVFDGQAATVGIGLDGPTLAGRGVSGRFNGQERGPAQEHGGKCGQRVGRPKSQETGHGDFKIKDFAEISNF
jgi:hypothetical protein